MPSEPPPPVRAPTKRFESVLQFSGRAGAWIRLRGEFDIAHTEQFAQSVEHALERALLVIVDLREATFIDTAGVHALDDADARARRARRRLVIIRGPAQINRVFELLGLSRWLEIIDLKPVLLSPPPQPAPVFAERQLIRARQRLIATSSARNGSSRTAASSFPTRPQSPANDRARVDRLTDSPSHREQGGPHG
jgi:anti-sigma B factor antagonist